MTERYQTTQLHTLSTKASTAPEILAHVYSALERKGFDPIAQLSGYILTGDPTYITSFEGARSMICRLERDEILEEIVRFYVENKLNQKNHG